MFEFLASAALVFVLALTIMIIIRVIIDVKEEDNMEYDIDQAAKVAEYLALARTLKEDSPVTEYRRANQLAWELALWLPEDIYKHMVKAIAQPSMETNELTTVILVRKLILGDKTGDLTADDICQHAPGIGKKEHKGDQNGS